MSTGQKAFLSVLAMIVVLATGASIFLGLNRREAWNASEQSTKTTTEATQQKNHDASDTNRRLQEANHLASQYDFQAAIAKLQGDENPQLKNKRQNYENQQKELVQWEDPAAYSHLFVHSLIVDPAIAFRTSQGQGYKDYMVTIPEFEKAIEQTYQRGYVLVNYADLLHKNEQGQLEFTGVSLPEGKKPLILSQDDVNYYEYMENSGFAEKLMIDRKQQIKNRYQSNGGEQVGDYDMVPIIDRFVAQHPDFSYRGSKGILAVTGYNGVLGYRSSVSSYGDTQKTKQAMAEAKRVADRLKETGWTFASHSWGHIDFAKSPLSDIQQDTQRFKNEVEPIIGKTNVLIYPFGADISDAANYTAANAKYSFLKGQGYDIFANVDASKPAWGQFTPAYYRNARINVDGLRFDSDVKGENNVLENFFQVDQVVDRQARAMP
ncbi:hydrolase [Enterococcus florum]|uniref:Hydrolase n=1 Tax=Enterococcus florum TaxID=2480627 RepID=A0A4V0WPB9_9ENTE|nr:polysaccharide deacetylase family protein [Enterococcus florum]GCF93319.1 hydrolase [Enterococcus florum]